MMMPASVSDYRQLAQRRLPRVMFDYVDGGAFSEATLAANVRDLDGLVLKQKVMRDVSTLDTGTIVLGHNLSMPVILAPVGFAGMMARRGEVQAARAAEAAGVPFTLSTVGICPIDEVRRATKSPFWFQLYMMRDRGFVRAMLARAMEAKCSALVFTVDLPVLGTRYRDIRNGMADGRPASAAIGAALDFMRHPGWVYDVALRGRPLTFGNLAGVVEGGHSLNHLRAWTERNLDPSVTWRDLEWVRETWKGPLILKGILDPEDAKLAIAHGANAIVVSNHGGRQLDGAPSTASVLPRIAEAVGTKGIVLVDGGVRSGQDVAKMLALGAKACLIGRPWVYGLAARGQAGVEAVLATFKQELRTTMALLGTARISDITHRVLEHGPITAA